MRSVPGSFFIFLSVVTFLSNCTKKIESDQKSFAVTTTKSQQLVLTHLREFYFPWKQLVKENLHSTPAFMEAEKKKWRRVCFLHSELTLDQVKKLSDTRITDAQADPIYLDKLTEKALETDNLSVENVRVISEQINKAIFQEIMHDSTQLYFNHMTTAKVLSTEAINFTLLEKYLVTRGNVLLKILQDAEADSKTRKNNLKSAKDDLQQAIDRTLFSFPVAAGISTLGGAIGGPFLAPFLIPVAFAGVTGSGVVSIGATYLRARQAKKSQKSLNQAIKKLAKADIITESLLDSASIDAEARTGHIYGVKEIVDPKDPAINIDLKNEIINLISDFKAWASTLPNASISSEKAIGLALGNHSSERYSIEEATQMFDNLANMNASHVACPPHGGDSSYTFPWLQSIDDEDGSFVFRDKPVKMF
jgi:hypothetical protein